MPKTKSDEIQDKVVTHQAYVTKLGEGQANKANKTVSKSDELIAAAIALGLINVTDTATVANLRRLTSLEKKITKIRKEAFDEAELDQTEDMEQLADTESKWLAALLLLLVGAKLSTLTASQVNRVVNLTIFAGRTRAQWWQSARIADVNRIMLAVRGGVQAGLGIRQIVRNVTGTRTISGVLQATRNDITALSRTITAGVSSAAQLATAKKSDSITRVQWVSVLDSRTSQICRGLSGMVWRIDEAHPTPPAHPRCRSSLTYLTGAEPRAEDLTYQQWLDNQPDNVVRDILPRWQYREYKNGVPLTQFLTKGLEPMTMGEFNKRFRT